MILQVEEHLRIELLNEEHSEALYRMIDSNRDYLREWLSFVDIMRDQTFAEQFIKGTMERNRAGMEYAFIIVAMEVPIGRIGVYHINREERIGEIGYWIKEDCQGNGYVTKCCRALIKFCFSDLALNRIDIKCGMENRRSKVIPERLGFRLVGNIPKGELLYDQWIDLNLYSLLKSDFIGGSNKDLV